jgi:addiction module HigA family antidote
MSKTVLVPGAVLREKLEEYHIPVAKVSLDIGLSPSAVRQLLNNKLKISIVIAQRLAQYFGTPVKFWIDLQTNYELAEMGKDSALVSALKKLPQAKTLPAPKKAPPAQAPKAVKGAKAAKKPGKKVVSDKKPSGKRGRPPKAAAGKAIAKPAAVKKPRKPRTTKPKAKAPAFVSPASIE